uniref:DNA polymerase n=1 Tax=Dactylella sp. TaxID=1814903 RepID=A0A482DQT6_9PEZI|nr:hypothetical protein [Dactylella sp.]
MLQNNCVSKMDVVIHSKTCLDLVVFRKGSLGLTIGGYDSNKKYYSVDSSEEKKMIDSGNSEVVNNDSGSNEILSENHKQATLLNNEDKVENFNSNVNLSLDDHINNKSIELIEHWDHNDQRINNDSEDYSKELEEILILKSKGDKKNYDIKYENLVNKYKRIEMEYFMRLDLESTEDSKGWWGSKIKSVIFNEIIIFKNFNKHVYSKDTVFNQINFIAAFLKIFRTNSTYSILIRVRYTFISSDGYSKSFAMLGEQLGVVFTDSLENNISVLENKYKNIVNRMREVAANYGAVNIDLVQIMYILNNSYSEFRIKNLNKYVKLNKDIVNVSKAKLEFNDRLLPMTLNENLYGIPINCETEYGYVSNININGVNYMDLIKENLNNKNKNIFKGFDKNTKFYWRIYKNEKFLIVVKYISEFVTEKIVYDENGIVLIENNVDTKLNDKEFVRKTTNNMSVYFYENKYVKHEIEIKFKTINTLRVPADKFESNPFIGTFDVETYNDGDKAKIYALGFSTLEMAKQKEDKVKMIYFNNNEQENNDLVLSCINTMLNTNNKDHTYYVHNFGKFDVVFVLKVILEYNRNIGHTYYHHNCSFRDSSILKLEIKIKTKTGFNKIKFVDSLSLLPINLGDLGESFDVKYKKGYFPYAFVNENTLNYIGNTPDRNWFKVGNKVIDTKIYSDFYKTNWSLKDETLNYLEKDLLCLLEVIDKFNKFIFINYGVQVTESLTISRLALNIFLKNYLGESKIGIINKKSVYNDIKKAYYGGINEVYKPYGKNLYYYDVNSLYPFAAKNIMPGHKCSFIESENPLDIYNLFGFFYAKIKTNNINIGLLPVKQNGLIHPNGSWEGWYFSEELKFAKDNDYEIEVFKGYQFNKVENIFNKYVDDLYHVKSTSSGSIKVIAKLLLNSLLGRFGMDILKLNTELVDLDKFKEIMATKSINSWKKVTENDYIVSYVDELSEKIINQHNLNYFELLNKNSNKTIENFNVFSDVSIAITAAITGYARIYMNKIKLEILKNGGNIYYMDTDSIVTDKPLHESLIGKELGQFKLEYKIKEAYFISSKTYCLITEDPKEPIVIKSKGVFSSLDLEKFKQLYLKQNVTGIKSDSKKDWSAGYVTIGTKEIDINWDSYTKRTKVYDELGNWVDTKPLVLKDGILLDNEIDKEIVKESNGDNNDELLLVSNFSNSDNLIKDRDNLLKTKKF